MTENNLYLELKNFYKDKKVYITGITGFKGTWLAMTLKQLGADVFGIGMLSEKNERSLANEIELDSYIPIVYGDITAPANHSYFLQTLSQHQPDVLFHLAERRVVDKEDNYDLFFSNIMGTVITHEIIRALDKKVSLVNVVPDKVWIDNETGETSVDPLAVAKKCSNLITESYSSLDDKIISSTIRTGSVIGGGDYAKNRIVPSCFNAMKNDEKLTVRYPNDMRSFIHIFDLMTAYLFVGMEQYNNDSFSDTYDVKPYSESISVKETVEKMNEYFDFNYELLPQEEKPLAKEQLKANKNFFSVSNISPIMESNFKALESVGLWYNSYVDSNDGILKVTKPLESYFNALKKEKGVRKYEI